MKMFFTTSRTLILLDKTRDHRGAPFSADENERVSESLMHFDSSFSKTIKNISLVEVNQANLVVC